MSKEATKTEEKAATAAKSYEKPEIKTLGQREVVQAVNKGAKFPARGFAG